MTKWHSVLGSLTFLLIITHLNRATEIPEKSGLAEELYKKLLKRQRAEQIAAIKSFQKIQNYEKQYQMINLIAEKVFTIVQDSRAVIEASPFIPGVSEFPLDDTVRDALSNIIENTALFAEVILRFPDIAVAVLKTNNNWDVLLQWGIAYCYQVKYLLDDSTVKVLSLAGQELNHTPRDPNFVNPYRKAREAHLREEEEAEELRKKKRKKKLKKGPKLHQDEF